jgi:1,3-beta-glucanosyltransferase GAS1
MASVAPTSTKIADYTLLKPTPACPTVGAKSDFNASSVLPPKPDAKLCSCMYESVRCVARPAYLDALNSTEFNNMIDNLCAGDSELCTGSLGDGRMGKYGAFKYVLNRP